MRLGLARALWGISGPRLTCIEVRYQNHCFWVNPSSRNWAKIVPIMGSDLRFCPNLYALRIWPCYRRRLSALGIEHQKNPYPYALSIVTKANYPCYPCYPPPSHVFNAWHLLVDRPFQFFYYCMIRTSVKSVYLLHDTYEIFCGLLWDLG